MYVDISTDVSTTAAQWSCRTGLSRVQLRGGHGTSVSVGRRYTRTVCCTRKMTTVLGPFTCSSFPKGYYRPSRLGYPNPKDYPLNPHPGLSE
ncbi:hypothetical protein PSACC_01186 [Paramicrosporidium saccamoebae]|uniref:Uncharacterized protein n=1 Tax=Paramicrosporidium saccamoebae TaxID=1246581 RepID=A0A2H9TMQ7_9FUNG|nr:hypothetical protein PSACC_01186 [Paramicrosporidium saccamoebae]